MKAKFTVSVFYYTSHLKPWVTVRSRISLPKSPAFNLFTSLNFVIHGPLKFFHFLYIWKQSLHYSIQACNALSLFISIYSHAPHIHQPTALRMVLLFWIYDHWPSLDWGCQAILIFLEITHDTNSFYLCIFSPFHVWTLLWKLSSPIPLCSDKYCLT